MGGRIQAFLRSFIMILFLNRLFIIIVVIYCDQFSFRRATRENTFSK